MTDSSNAPLADAPTNYNVQFRIYNNATGGDVLWGETQTVTVFQGRLSVLLGQGQALAGTPDTSLSDVVNGGDGGELYIGITLPDEGTGAEFSPRQRMLPSAYAYRATLAGASNPGLPSPASSAAKTSRWGETSLPPTTPRLVAPSLQ